MNDNNLEVSNYNLDDIRSYSGNKVDSKHMSNEKSFDRHNSIKTRSHKTSVKKPLFIEPQANPLEDSVNVPAEIKVPVNIRKKESSDRRLRSGKVFRSSKGKNPLKKTSNKKFRDLAESSKSLRYSKEKVVNEQAIGNLELNPYSESPEKNQVKDVVDAFAMAEYKDYYQFKHNNLTESANEKDLHSRLRSHARHESASKNEKS